VKPTHKGSLLFVAPAFYDYHIEITRELERQGYDVAFFPERPTRVVYSLAKKLPAILKNFIFNRYLSRMLGRIRERKFDTFFLIRGEILTRGFLRELQEINPEAYSVMYQWDSLKVCNYKDLIPFFNRVITFDQVDAQSMSLEYIPLFYHPEFKLPPPDGKETYDLVFVGSFSEERYQVIRKVKAFSERQGLCFYAYLYISPLDYGKLLLKGKAPLLQDIKFRQITRADILALYRQTKAILDIENSRQTGLTMRTFEALATGRKFVTTNGKAVELMAEFHANILLVDRESFSVEKGDLQKAAPLGASIESHSLPNWISAILNVS